MIRLPRLPVRYQKAHSVMTEKRLREVDQIEDVNKRPDEPSRESGKGEVSNSSNSFGLTNRWQVAPYQNSGTVFYSPLMILLAKYFPCWIATGAIAGRSVPSITPASPITKTFG